MGISANLTVRVVGRVRFTATPYGRSGSGGGDSRRAASRSASALAIPGLRLLTLGEDGVLRIEMADGELQVRIRGGRVESPPASRRRRQGGRIASATSAASEDGSEVTGLDQRAVQTLDQVYSVVRSRPLGTGAFSSVVLGFHSTSGKSVAVKTVDLRELTPRERAAAVAEPTLLRQLKHPNIVQLADVFVDPDAGTLSVLTALAAGGSLSAAAARDGRLPGTAARFGEPATRLILANVLDGLAYLHAEGIVHRDIKPSNILLTGLVPSGLAKTGGGGRGGRGSDASGTNRGGGLSTECDFPATPTILTLTAADRKEALLKSSGRANQQEIYALIGDLGLAVQLRPRRSSLDDDAGNTSGGWSRLTAAEGGKIRRGPFLSGERESSVGSGSSALGGSGGSGSGGGGGGATWARHRPSTRWEPVTNAVSGRTRPARPPVPSSSTGGSGTSSGGGSGEGGGAGNWVGRGGASASSPTGLLFDIVGSAAYMAPEITARHPVSGQRTGYGAPIDVWALGVTLAWMLVGDESLASVPRSKWAAATRALSQPATSLLRGMLQPLPSKRLTAAAARLHPFFDADVRTSVMWGERGRHPSGRFPLRPWP
ncbi:hypothetical protein MMPV_006609 [Pyropia vietnamensis]